MCDYTITEDGKIACYKKSGVYVYHWPDYVSIISLKDNILSVLTKTGKTHNINVKELDTSILADFVSTPSLKYSETIPDTLPKLKFSGIVDGAVYIKDSLIVTEHAAQIAQIIDPDCAGNTIELVFKDGRRDTYDCSRSTFVSHTTGDTICSEPDDFIDRYYCNNGEMTKIEVEIKPTLGEYHVTTQDGATFTISATSFEYFSEMVPYAFYKCGDLYLFARKQMMIMTYSAIFPETIHGETYYQNITDSMKLFTDRGFAYILKPDGSVVSFYDAVEVLKDVTRFMAWGKTNRATYFVANNRLYNANSAFAGICDSPEFQRYSLIPSIPVNYTGEPTCIYAPTHIVTYNYDTFIIAPIYATVLTKFATQIKNMYYNGDKLYNLTIELTTGEIKRAFYTLKDESLFFEDGTVERMMPKDGESMYCKRGKYTIVPNSCLGRRGRSSVYIRDKCVLFGELSDKPFYECDGNYIHFNDVDTPMFGQVVISGAQKNTKGAV